MANPYVQGNGGVHDCNMEEEMITQESAHCGMHM